MTMVNIRVFNEFFEEVRNDSLMISKKEMENYYNKEERAGVLIAKRYKIPFGATDLVLADID